MTKLLFRYPKLQKSPAVKVLHLLDVKWNTLENQVDPFNPPPMLPFLYSIFLTWS